MPLAKKDLIRLNRTFGDGTAHGVQDALIVEMRLKYIKDEEAQKVLLKFDRKEHNEGMRRRDELSEQQKANYRLEERERIKREDESIARERTRRTIEGE